MNKKTLVLEKITIGYKQNTLIEDISCSFKNNGINLILGRSGAGKSTLLKTIAGFHKQNSGHIRLNNKEFKPLGNFALAFQNPEVLFFNSTVGEEILFGLNQLEYDEDTKIELAKKWLEKWGVKADKFWARHPMSLSGGEQRKVALAACTVFSPEIIMLDEPLAGLDNSGQNEIINVLKQISNESIVIVVTHDISKLLQITTNIIVFNFKRIYTFDSVSDFLQACIGEDPIYKLPSWYINEINKFPIRANLPIPDAEAVFEYIKNK